MLDFDEVIEELNGQMSQYDVEFEENKEEAEKGTRVFLSKFDYFKFSSKLVCLGLILGYEPGDGTGYAAYLEFGNIEDMNMAESLLKQFKNNVSVKGRVLEYKIFNNTACCAIVEEHSNTNRYDFADAYSLAKRIKDSFQTLIYSDYIQKIDLWNR